LRFQDAEMFITYRGNGLYALLPIFTGGITDQIITHAFALKPLDIGHSHPCSTIAFITGALIGTCVIWWMAQRARKKARILIDPETQETVRLESTDSLYGVSLRSWAIVWFVFIGFGVYVSIKELLAL
jgi:hypothetical protein